MQLKITKKTNYFFKTFLIYILFVSIALSYCVIPYEIAPNFYLSIPILMEILCLITLSLLNLKKFCLIIKNFIQLKVIKILFFWFCLVLITGLLVSILGGQTSFFSVILNMLSRILRFLLPLYFGFYFTKILKNKDTIKIIYSIIFIMLFIGVVDFISNIFNISSLQTFLRCLANANNLELKDYNYISFRIKSTFAEPSFFAYFICLFFPFIYMVSFSKYKIYKNKYLNFIIKKTFPFLAIILILLTKSPIFIIYGIFISIISFALIKKINLKRILIYTIPIILFLAILLNQILHNINSVDTTTVIGRILVSIKSLLKLKDLIMFEPSLATRVISYINLFQIFKNNIILGCGIGNLQASMMTQFQYYSPVLLTPEIANSIQRGSALMNANIFFQLLAESGIIAISFFYFFVYKIYSMLTRIKMITSGFELLVFNTFTLYLVSFVILSFYDSNIYLSYLWTLFGIFIGFYNNIKISIARKTLLLQIREGELDEK